MTVSPFSEGLAAVRTDNRWGFVNKSGQAVIPMVFDRAWNFSVGLALVGVSGHMSIINAKGKVIAGSGDFPEIQGYHEHMIRVEMPTTYRGKQVRALGFVEIHP